MLFLCTYDIYLKLNKNNTLEVDGRKNSRKRGEELLFFFKSDECRIREREKRDRKVKRKKEKSVRVYGN